LAVLAFPASCSTQKAEVKCSSTEIPATEEKDAVEDRIDHATEKFSMDDIFKKCAKCEKMLAEVKQQFDKVVISVKDPDGDLNKERKTLEKMGKEERKCFEDWKAEATQALSDTIEDPQIVESYVLNGLEEYCGDLFNYYYKKVKIEYKTPEEINAELKACDIVGSNKVKLPKKHALAYYFEKTDYYKPIGKILSGPVSISVGGKTYTFTIEKCLPGNSCKLKGETYYDSYGNECYYYVVRMNSGTTDRWLLLSSYSDLEQLKLKQVLLGKEEAVLMYGEDHSGCCEADGIKNIMIFRIDKKKGNAFIYLKITDDKTSKIPGDVCGKGADCDMELVDSNGDTVGELKLTNKDKICVVLKQDKKSKYLWKGALKGLKYKADVELHGYMHLDVYFDETLGVPQTMPEW
jgi:hypothetical protein